jgi:GNAT superfamily N-acetyltransferase
VSSISIRRLSADSAVDRDSWATIRAICCRTGNNGEPIADNRWEFFSKIWIEPYEKILPEWAYVAEADGTIVGYLTGCPHTKSFSRAKRWRCTLPLLSRILFGSLRRAPDARGFAWQELGMRKSAEKSFARTILSDISRLYPAHLHMNVERQFRRAGIGKRLLERLSADLRRQGVSGIHLFCGRDPMPFYLGAGFQVLGTSHFRGREVFVLGQLLQIR